MAFATTASAAQENKLARILNERMAEMDMGLNDLAKAAGSTYEYVRKLSRGLATPSKYMLNTVAAVLKLDAETLQDAATEDRLRSKMGESYLRVKGINPKHEALLKMFEQLEKTQQQQITDTMETFIKNNRKRKRA